MSNPLLRKLEKWCPTHYDVHWDPLIPNQPPRLKLTTPNLSAYKLNILWAEAVSIVTNSNYIVTNNYIRISAHFENYTIATSIFPTGCIMFQGCNVLKWLDRFFVQICRKVNTKINDPNLVWSRGKDEIPPELQNEISVEGLCIICNGKDNGEMLLCENLQCCTWSHALCEGFNEENLLDISHYFCPVCMKNDISKSVFYFDSTKSSNDSNFSEWINESSKSTVLTNASICNSKLSPIPPAQNVNLYATENSLSNFLNVDSFENTQKSQESCVQQTPFLSLTKQDDTPPLESQKSLTFKQTVSTPKNKSSNKLFCGNTSPIFGDSVRDSSHQPEILIGGNKTAPKNWLKKWSEIRSSKKQTQFPVSILAKENHPDCTKNPFSPASTVRQRLLPVIETTEIEGEIPSTLSLANGGVVLNRTFPLCSTAQSAPLRRNVTVGGGRDSDITSRDPLSSVFSDNRKSPEKIDPAVPSKDEASTANLNKYLQERVSKLQEENQSLILDQSMKQQKMQTEIENLTEAIRHRDELICSIYKNNHEEDRIKYFKNMDPEKLIRSHIKLQNMYHTLKFLYDDAVKTKDSLKLQLNEERIQNDQSNLNESDTELETIKYEEILKQYEKIKAKQLTNEKQKSELMEKLKQQKEEIKMLELLCEQNKVLYEKNEDISEAPCTYIVESSQNESIQEMKQKIYKRKTAKIQNSKIFYKKGFDPRVFEQSKNIYEEFKRRVKEQVQLDAEDSSKQAIKPPEGVKASQAFEVEDTAGSPNKIKPIKKRNQISPRISNEKSYRPTCWYYLHNMCKFGNQCRNKHITNTDQPNFFNSQKNSTASRPKSNKKINFQTKTMRNSYQNGNHKKVTLNESLFNGYEKNRENCLPLNSLKTPEESGSQLCFDKRGYHSVPSNQHLSQYFPPENTQF